MPRSIYLSIYSLGSLWFRHDQWMPRSNYFSIRSCRFRYEYITQHPLAFKRNFIFNSKTKKLQNRTISHRYRSVTLFELGFFLKSGGRFYGTGSIWFVVLSGVYVDANIEFEFFPKRFFNNVQQVSEGFFFFSVCKLYEIFGYVACGGSTKTENSVLRARFCFFV